MITKVTSKASKLKYKQEKIKDTMDAVTMDLQELRTAVEDIGQNFEQIL